jgi:hypothetical protein
MASDATQILAGVSAGTGNALVSMATTGATAPTSASSTLASPWRGMGWVTTDGVAVSKKIDSNEIDAFGSAAAVRVLKTSATTTLQVEFLQSSPNVLEVYNELPLDSITVTSGTGAFDFTDGPLRTQRYALCFTALDGANIVRGYAPLVEVTDKDDFKISAGDAISANVTLTCYPGSDGTAIHWFYVVAALISS